MRMIRLVQRARLSKALVAAVVLLSMAWPTAFAQRPRVTVRVTSDKALPVPTGFVQRVVIGARARAVAADLVRRDRGFLLLLPDQPPVALPRDLAVMVSGDGSTILQFGDETVKMPNPPRTDLYWMDARGQVLGKLLDYYAGNAVVSMSDDGYTAVAGHLFGRPGLARLGLYTRAGVKVWEVSVDEKDRIAAAVVGPGGGWVAVLATDAKSWLRDHRIQLYDKAGVAASRAETGIIQKLAALGDGHSVFVQCHDRYGLLDISMGRLTWHRPGKVRMVSPYGAALSPDGRSLFLLEADVKDRPEPDHPWKLRALEASTGEDMAVEYLPGRYPSTWDPVFERITASEIRILAGDHRLTYGWAREGQ